MNKRWYLSLYTCINAWIHIQSSCNLSVCGRVWFRRWSGQPLRGPSADAAGRKSHTHTRALLLFLSISWFKLLFFCVSSLFIDRLCGEARLLSPPWLLRYRRRRSARTDTGERLRLNTHTHTHTHTHTISHRLTHIDTDNTHAHSLTHTHTRTHTHTIAHTQSHTHTDRHTLTHNLTHTHTHTHSLSHTHIISRTHTFT